MEPQAACPNLKASLNWDEPRGQSLGLWEAAGCQDQRARQRKVPLPRGACAREASRAPGPGRGPASKLSAHLHGGTRAGVLLRPDTQCKGSRWGWWALYFWVSGWPSQKALAALSASFTRGPGGHRRTPYLLIILNVLVRHAHKQLPEVLPLVALPPLQVGFQIGIETLHPILTPLDICRHLEGGCSNGGS